jgi:zinc-ribbon domain
MGAAGTRVQREEGEDETLAEAPDRYCGNCGHELSPTDQFCRNCGTPVHRAATVPTPEADVPVPPPPQAGGAGGGDAAAAQAPPQESVRRGLSNPYNLGCLGVVGFILFAIAVAAIIGGIRNGGGDNGGGEVADKPKQERQAAQQVQPQKKDPQLQQEEQQAQGGQEEQKGGEQKPEPQEPEPQEPNFASFGDGTHQVGTNVQPGTYRTRVGSPNCYWERLKNFSGGINGILANGGTSAPKAAGHGRRTCLPSRRARPLSARVLTSWART